MARPDTLDKSMRYHDRLHVRCRCGHEGSFSQAEAVAVFGPDATPYAVKRRLRCSACAEVGHVEVWI